MYTESTIEKELEKEGLKILSDIIKTRKDTSHISHEVDFVDVLTGDVFTYAVAIDSNNAYPSNFESWKAFKENKTITVEAKL
jgi:signal transduction protein with GAF and PtsI domain